MKKLFLVCATVVGLFANSNAGGTTNNNEVYGGVGVAVTTTDAPVTKVQVTGGYVYNFTPKESVGLSYDYTPVEQNFHTFLGSYRRNFGTKTVGPKVLTPFVSVGVGATEFQTSSVVKFTTRFGAGVSTPIKHLNNAKMSIGAYGTKIDTVPVYFSTVVTLSKSF